jgi:hypothetical protein
VNGELALQLQRDEQQEARPEVAARAAAMALIKEVHTCLPGRIESFDSATCTVRATPLIQRIFVGFDTPFTIPVCVDVPLLVNGGGGIRLTFPVAQGDECLLHFSERAINFWHEHGGEQLPSNYRTHSYSDAFAEVGPFSLPNVLSPAISTDAAELRTADGATKIALKSGEIDVQADAVVLNGGSAGVARTGDAVKLTMLPADVLNLATALLATGQFTPTGSSPTPPPPVEFDQGEITGGSGSVKAGD